MIDILYILLYLVLGILIYRCLLIVIQHSKNGSPWRHFGDALFASLSRFYERVQAGTLRVYNTFAEKELNNLLGLLGTIICTISLFLLIIIDISFISLMGAQFWGSDPELLAEEISTAANTVIPITSVTDYFDSLLNWAVSHVAVNPSGHFLAANALITIICLIIAGLFIKECAKPTGWLPLNLKKFGRWFVGSVNVALLLCLIFYYGFLIYYGVSSQVAVGAETQSTVNYFDDTNVTTDEIRNPLESLNGAKLAASVCYAIAVLGVNFMAFWGMLLFYGIVVTLFLVFFRWILEAFYDHIILPLGIALGYVQLQRQAQKININQQQAESTNTTATDDQAQENETQNDTPNSEERINDEELQNLRDEIEERRIAEEERQRNINDDPLNLD